MIDTAVTLEGAKAGDLDAIVAIAAESFASPWSRSSYADELARTDGARWVARIGPERVGFLLGRIQVDHLEVLSLAVAPAKRRAGCGAALVSAALADADARGVSRVQLEVRVSAEPALACYRHAGFEVVGRRSGYYADGEDALLLSRGAGGPG